MRLKRKMKNYKNIIGIICGVLTGIGWGLSGIFSQYLFSSTTMEPGWFVSVRMIISGMMLIIYGLFTHREELKKLFTNKKDLIVCMLAGVLGNMLFQLSCYSAVKESNAPTAIVLQYICPVIIIVYMCLRARRLPKRYEVLSIVFAVMGVFLITTHGRMDQLILTPCALLFGLGTAFFMALGTIIPENLYKKYSVQSITGVMMVTGGIVASFIIKPWINIPTMNMTQCGALSGAILFGGILSYIFYANAIKIIGSQRASLCACAEIPASTILAVIFLNNTFSIIDFAGFAFIISTIFIAAIKNKQPTD